MNIDEVAARVHNVDDVGKFLAHRNHMGVSRYSALSSRSRAHPEIPAKIGDMLHMLWHASYINSLTSGFFLRNEGMEAVYRTFCSNDLCLRFILAEYAVIACGDDRTAGVQYSVETGTIVYKLLDDHGCGRSKHICLEK